METLGSREPEAPASGTEGWQAPAERGVVPERLVYEVGAGRWVRPQWAPTATQAGWGTTWAGPRTLARTCPGALALLDLDRPDSPRYLIGRPPS